MSWILRLVLCVCMATTTAEVILLLRSLRHTINAIPQTIERQAEETRALAKSEMEAVRADLRNESAAYRAMADRQLGASRKELLTRIDAAVLVADFRLASIQSDLNRSVDGARADLRPVLDAYAKLPLEYAKLPEDAKTLMRPYLDCDANGLCWQGLITDNLTSLRYATREAGKAAPAISKAAQQVAESTAETTKYTAETAKNFSAATKPLPFWVRYLPLLGSAAQVALPFLIR